MTVAVVFLLDEDLKTIHLFCFPFSCCFPHFFLPLLFPLVILSSLSIACGAAYEEYEPSDHTLFLMSVTLPLTTT